MRFKRKNPKEGDRKIKRMYALLPIFLGSEIRWMEWVHIEYIFIIEGYPIGKGRWYRTKFINL